MIYKLWETLRGSITGILVDTHGKVISFVLILISHKVLGEILLESDMQEIGMFGGRYETVDILSSVLTISVLNQESTFILHLENNEVSTQGLKLVSSELTKS